MFFFWLELLDVKSQIFLMTLIDFLEASEWSRNSIRAVPWLLFQGWYKSLDLNKITSGGPEYTNWNNIRNQALKVPDIAR